ncbi:MAG: hypothetical protein WB789_08750 [Thermoplasmata archaeon]
MAEMFQTLGAAIGPVLVAWVLARFTGTFDESIESSAGPDQVRVQLPTFAGFHGSFAIRALWTAALGVLASFLRNYHFAEASAPATSGRPKALPVPPRFVE